MHSSIPIHSKAVYTSCTIELIYSKFLAIKFSEYNFCVALNFPSLIRLIKNFITSFLVKFPYYPYKLTILLIIILQQLPYSQMIPFLNILLNNLFTFGSGLSIFPFFFFYYIILNIQIYTSILISIEIISPFSIIENSSFHGFWRNMSIAAPLVALKIFHL